MTKTSKAEIARAHRSQFLQKVRDGEMSKDEFLLTICGVPAHRLEEMRALLPL